MLFGVCADPKYGAVLAQVGFDFIELNVQSHLKTLSDDDAFAPVLSSILASPLPAIAANSFVPGALKIVGPEVETAALEAYVKRALSRAARAGVKAVVFGSGGARAIPDGFDRGLAWDQLLAFGRLAAEIAQEHDVTLVVEPLNQRECNVLTTVGESGRYVEAVDHPHLQLLVDAYHWALDNDSFDDIVAFGPLLRHVHIATRDSRLPPGCEPADFAPFFRALKLSGYDGAVSVEARWDDIEKQAPYVLQTLKHLAYDAGFHVR